MACNLLRGVRSFSSASTMSVFDSILASGTYKFYLNGEWRESTSGKSVSIKNPQTNDTAFTVQACTPAEVDAAYKGAADAQQEWAKTPLWKRADLIKNAAAKLREHSEAIGKILTVEVAKQAKSADSEVVRSAELMEYCAEEAVRYLGQGDLLLSDSFPGTARNKICMSSKVSLGVVLCIPPFNYPVNLAVSKVAPALMAGNAVVLKPPTQGAVAGLHMVHAFHLAGVPPGLIQCVTGKGSEIGDYMTMHPGANCISFTGGSTGISISKKAGMVPLQMELGGKDVCLVCPDADLDLAATSIVKGGLSYQGQRCTAVKVVMAHDSVADALVSKVMEKVAKLTVGKPEDNCDIAAVISESSANWIEELVTGALPHLKEDLAFDVASTAAMFPLNHTYPDAGAAFCNMHAHKHPKHDRRYARDKGAKMLTEWKREGNLIYPQVIDHVTSDMKLAWEEQFGPVLPFMRVEDMFAAVKHCNDSNLALQGCVFTANIDTAMKLSDSMKTGTVQVNGPPARGPDHFPFQGFRESGIGSQGIRNSLAMMCKTKTTVINMPEASYTLG